MTRATPYQKCLAVHMRFAEPVRTIDQPSRNWAWWIVGASLFTWLILYIAEEAVKVVMGLS